MANELQVGISLRLVKGEITDQLGLVTDTLDVAASPAKVLRKVVNVTTSDVALTTTEIGTLGWAYIKNLGPTNYLEFGPDVAGAIVPAIRLKVGEHAVFRMVPGETYRHQANTAAVDMLVVLYDD